MITLPKKELKKLKKPLGKVYTTMEKIKELSHNHRIVSVGDICTLALLAVGIKPHLAVFDYMYMRRKLDDMFIAALENAFKTREKYKNPRGTLSKKLLKDAPKLMKKGGAVLIDGEEDLTALAFIANAGKKDIIVYGQPKKGMVIVVPEKKLKIRIRTLLSVVAFSN